MRRISRAAIRYHREATVFFHLRLGQTATRDCVQRVSYSRYVTLTLMTFDNQLNARRIGVESSQIVVVTTA